MGDGGAPLATESIVSFTFEIPTDDDGSLSRTKEELVIRGVGLVNGTGTFEPSAPRAIFAAGSRVAYGSCTWLRLVLTRRGLAFVEVDIAWGVVSFTSEVVTDGDSSFSKTEEGSWISVARAGRGAGVFSGLVRRGGALGVNDFLEGAATAAKGVVGFKAFSRRARCRGCLSGTRRVCGASWIGVTTAGRGTGLVSGLVEVLKTGLVDRNSVDPGTTLGFHMGRCDIHRDSAHAR